MSKLFTGNPKPYQNPYQEQQLDDESKHSRGIGDGASKTQTLTSVPNGQTVPELGSTGLDEAELKNTHRYWEIEEGTFKAQASVPEPKERAVQEVESIWLDDAELINTGGVGGGASKTQTLFSTPNEQEELELESAWFDDGGLHGWEIFTKLKKVVSRQ
jgi:hypothetical protein